VFSLKLTACTPSEEVNYDSAWAADIEKDIRVSGSVGDGPTVNATVTIRKDTGEAIASFKSDASAHYEVDLAINERFFPLLIDAQGGVDLVTNTAPDFVLRSAVFSMHERVTANINPFSTIAVELARNLNGGLTRDNLLEAEDIVATSLNSGLTTLAIAGPVQTPVDGTNLAEIVKASEVLAEIVRRTRDALNGAGYSANMGSVIESLGADLIDGVIEGNGGAGADARTAAVANIVSAEVTLEALRNELRVNGVDITDVMRSVIERMVPTATGPSLDELGATGEMIYQAGIGLEAAYEITSDIEIAGALQALDGVQPGMEPAFVRPLLSADYSKSLDDAVSKTAKGDKSVVDRVNDLARSGGSRGGAKNRRPAISGKPPTQVLVGTSYAFTPVASDLDNDPLTFSVTAKPAWATFDASNGRLSGTPQAADAGIYEGVTITVSDGELTNSIGPFAIEVTSNNASPSISGTPPGAVQAGSNYDFTPTASDPDNDPLTFSITAQPAWAAFDAATGRLSGVPQAGDVGRYPGIEITVSDGELTSSIGPFAIDVNGNNSAPSISGAPPAAVQAGSNYDFTPIASDPDNDPLTFSVTGKPAWAVFDTSTGRLSGTPQAADAGRHDGITITVSDGELSNSIGPFTIEVNGSNAAPQIGGTPAATVEENSRYEFMPTASDPDDDPLTFSITGKPAWATFDALTGKLSGAPQAGDVGVYQGIEITVSDGEDSATLPAFSIEVVASGSATGAVTLNWTPPTRNEDGSELTDLTAYRILWSRDGNGFSSSVRIDNPGITGYVVENLAPGTYEFVATAINGSGVESRFSNAITRVVE
jgi:hypothetical protein